MKVLFFITCFIFLGLSAHAQEWELKRSANNIKVYTRELDSTKINEYKAVLIANTSVENVVSIITNGNGLKNWNHKTPESETLLKVSDKEYIFWMKNDLPWPITDRDHVCKVSVEKISPKNYKIDISPADTILRLPEYNTIRIENFKGFWLINEIDENTVEITQQMYGDPKGTIPSWLVNSILTSFPFHSFENLKEILEN
ncbi:START domain-containing protein [Galbibacter mesophilus]|uniref:START domain-containing protein n=1 Tax=Galbibacter mesophilus TaxID=379069 RepID=UPI00191F4D70|nr:START domain-containing protein [Galbibacter mesophilus]MCM5662545.1 START domain-containing protein [Galbibacter mesophilus]